MLYHISPVVGLQVLEPCTSTLLTALRQAVSSQALNSHA